MRIHSDTLSAMHIINRANSIDGVHVNTITRHGSRSRANSFDVYLNGHSISGGQWGSADGKTASWDDWGQVIGLLYEFDPAAIIGPYKSVEHFNDVTVNRFAFPTMRGPLHHRHRWQYDAQDSDGSRWFYCKGTKAIECTAEQHLPRVGSKVSN